MVRKLDPADFRAVRKVLDPSDFALAGDEPDPPPTDLVSEETWDGIMTLPDDVSIRISDHHGTRLELLYSLWGDWITATGVPESPEEAGEFDEIYNCMLDAADCFQCASFNLLHGYYRAALAQLRTALELVMIGAYGTLNPNDRDYLAWKEGSGELTFGRCRRRLSGTLSQRNAKWMFEDRGLLATTYQALCNYTHSRPDSNDGSLWHSNGPVYSDEAINLTFVTSLSAYALCYLLVRLARAEFSVPEDSEILFELDWMPDHAALVRAYTDLYGEPPRPPLMD